MEWMEQEEILNYSPDEYNAEELDKRIKELSGQKVQTVIAPSKSHSSGATQSVTKKISNTITAIKGELNKLNKL